MTSIGNELAPLTGLEVPNQFRSEAQLREAKGTIKRLEAADGLYGN